MSAMWVEVNRELWEKAKKLEYPAVAIDGKYVVLSQHYEMLRPAEIDAIVQGKHLKIPVGYLHPYYRPANKCKWFFGTSISITDEFSRFFYPEGEGKKYILWLPRNAVSNKELPVRTIYGPDEAYLRIACTILTDSIIYWYPTDVFDSSAWSIELIKMMATYGPKADISCDINMGIYALLYLIHHSSSDIKKIAQKVQELRNNIDSRRIRMEEMAIQNAKFAAQIIEYEEKLNKQQPFCIDDIPRTIIFDIKEGRLTWDTPPIPLTFRSKDNGGITEYVGTYTYRVSVDILDGYVSFTRLDGKRANGTTDIKSNYLHPHGTSPHGCCLGTFTEPVYGAIQARNYTYLVDLIHEFLSKANYDDGITRYAYSEVSTERTIAKAAQAKLDQMATRTRTRTRRT